MLLKAPRTAEPPRGGLVRNLGYHWQKEALPVWLVLVHGAAAALGLVVLALAVWTLP